MSATNTRSSCSTLAESGKLGWSSGTASHLVMREQDGAAHRVKRWPLGLDASLTHTPAEPRNSVMPLKSLSDLTPIPDDLQANAEAVGDTAQSDEPEAEAKSTILEAEQSASEDNHMEITEEKLSELMQRGCRCCAQITACREARRKCYCHQGRSRSRLCQSWRILQGCQNGRSRSYARGPSACAR